jgi:hypothetical protein
LNLVQMFVGTICEMCLCVCNGPHALPSPHKLHVFLQVQLEAERALEAREALGVDIAPLQGRPALAPLQRALDIPRRQEEGDVHERVNARVARKGHGALVLAIPQKVVDEDAVEARPPPLVPARAPLFAAGFVQVRKPLIAAPKNLLLCLD